MIIDNTAGKYSSLPSPRTFGLLQPSASLLKSRRRQTLRHTHLYKAKFVDLSIRVFPVDVTPLLLCWEVSLSALKGSGLTVSTNPFHIYLEQQKVARTFLFSFTLNLPRGKTFFFTIVKATYKTGKSMSSFF